MKTEILAAIGETELQPATTLNAALAANDRLKYFFSLLQLAMDHAGNPETQPPTLQRERIACGVDDPDFDSIIANARMQGKCCYIRSAEILLDKIRQDLGVMAAPLTAAEHNQLSTRLKILTGAMPRAKDDLLEPTALSAMMQAGHGAKDSLHRLVMDMHKQLNAMQAALATETLDGAATYQLAPAHRPLVAAFMAGLNRTAKLKFNHPGLATTATSAGAKLILQNDIGTTDAHVIVIHVDTFDISVTYTDVHAERLKFFQDLLKPQNFSWESSRDAVLRNNAPFTMVTGRIACTTPEACGAGLEHLGAQLVFLIDWNRARKQLRGFLRAPDRLALLSWAAEKEIGHRGFLELGGARAINRAIEVNAGTAMHFGDRLCDSLGDEEALQFLRFVFTTATAGLLAGQSQSFMNDRIRAALAMHLKSHGWQLLGLVADHAGLVFELATLVQDGVQIEVAEPGKRAKRARRFEHDADVLVAQAREAVRRRPDYAMFLPLLIAADGAADALEDAAFFLSLDAARGKPCTQLRDLAALLVDASQEWIKALGHAVQIGTAGGNAETEEFLVALDRISAIEHEADNQERALAEAAFHHAEDFRQLHLFNLLSDRLENAADALKHASLMLRDYMMEHVLNG